MTTAVENRKRWEAPKIKHTEEDVPDGNESSSSPQQTAELELDAYGKHYKATDLEVDGQDLEARGFEFLHSWFSELQCQRKNLLDVWQLQWELFLNIHKNVRYRREFGTQVKMPVAFESVYTELPRIYEALFPEVWKKIVARDPAMRDQARNLDAMIDYNFEKEEWPMVIMDAILLACIHGHAPVMISWERNQKMITEPQYEMAPDDPLAASGMRDTRKPWESKSRVIEKESKKVVTVEEGATLTMLRPHDFFMDFNQKDPDKAPGGCAYQKLVDQSWIRNGERSGYLLPGTFDKVTRKLTKSGAENGDFIKDFAVGPHSDYSSGGGTEFNWDTFAWEWEYDQSRRCAAGIDGYTWQNLDRSRKLNAKHLIRHFFGPFPLFGYDEPWVECDVIFIGPFMVRCVENTIFRPLQLITCQEIPEYFHGFGKISPIETLIKGINEMANLMIEMKGIQVRPPLLVGQGSGLPAKPIVMESGTVLRPTHPSLVQWLTPPADAGGGEAAIGFMTQAHRSANGQPAVIRGESEGTRQTGTEVSIHREEASARVRMEASRNEWRFQKKVLRKKAKLLQLFLTQSHWVRVLGEDGQKTPMLLDRRSILGEFDYVAMGAKQTSNQSLHVQQLGALYDRALNSLAVVPAMQRFNFPEALIRIADTLGVRGISELMPAGPDEMAPKGTPQMELQLYIDGGTCQPKPGLENIAYMQFYDQPITDKATGMPMTLPNGEPMTVHSWVMFGDNNIAWENRVRFHELYMTRSMFATSFLQEQMMAQQQMQMQGAMQPPQPGGGGAPGGGGGLPPPPTAGGVPPHLLGSGMFPAGPPQEMPRSPQAAESAVRRVAQQQAAAVTQGQKERGFR